MIAPVTWKGFDGEMWLRCGSVDGIYACGTVPGADVVAFVVCKYPGCYAAVLMWGDGLLEPFDTYESVTQEGAKDWVVGRCEKGVLSSRRVIP